MSKPPLSKEEIRDLINLLREIFTYFQNLRSRTKLAEKIQFPKIPSVLSESIIYHLISEKKLFEALSDEVLLGGNADIIIKDHNGKQVKIEVKATGSENFQYLSQKDINCDYLVWVSFGDYFLINSRTFIQIFVLNEPKKFFNNPIKIMLGNFIKIAGTEIQITDFDLSNF